MTHRAITATIMFGALALTAVSLQGQSRSPFAGSTPTPPVTETVALRFDEAIERGLRYNLGLIETVTLSADTRAARLHAFAALLPTVTARAATVYENLSLREVGLTLPGLPAVTGGFGFEDARVSVSQSVLNGELHNRYRSGLAAERASALNARDARDLVVFAVGAAYLQIEASTARRETAVAQLAIAKELDRLTADRVQADVAPEIDGLRAQVQRQTAELRVISTTNDLEKDKLTLARMIGLAIEQPFVVDGPQEFRPVVGWTEATSKDAAFRLRADLAGAAANIDAAEFELRAVRAEQHPSIAVSADFGGGGDRGSFNQVYTVVAGVSVPLYTGGRIHAEIARAEAEVARRRAEYEDLKGQVAYDVRVSWLDLAASSAGVAVAQRNQELADRALGQAQDRYASDVTNYLEVVEAQEAVVNAHEKLVATLYGFNVAKLALARATGGAEASVKELFKQ